MDVHTCVSVADVWDRFLLTEKKKKRNALYECMSMALTKQSPHWAVNIIILLSLKVFWSCFFRIASGICDILLTME